MQTKNKTKTKMKNEKKKTKKLTLSSKLTFDLVKQKFDRNKVKIWYSPFC